MLLGGCRRGKCPTTLIDTWGRFRSTIRGNQVAIVLEDSPQLMHGPAITSASMPLGAFACLRKVRHAAAGERGGVPAPSSRRSLPTVGPENSNASIWSKPLKPPNPKTLKLLNPAAPATLQPYHQTLPYHPQRLVHRPANSKLPLPPPVRLGTFHITASLQSRPRTAGGDSLGEVHASTIDYPPSQWP